MGEEDCKVIGAYGRDTRVSDSNGTSLLRFAGDNKLALVNTFFSVPKGCTSRTFNGTRPADRKRINYIITRQSHRKLVRNVTVHLQPYADSDHNIVCARVRLPGRFARNRKQRAPTGRKSIDRRSITSDTDRRERLIQLVAIQLTQTELGGLGGTVGEKAAIFTDTLLRSAEEVMPGQIRQSRTSGLLEDEAMHDEFEEAWTGGRRPGRRYTAPWLAALLSARYGRHAKNSGTSFKLQRTGTWRCSPVNSRNSS